MLVRECGRFWEGRVPILESRLNSSRLRPKKPFSRIGVTRIAIAGGDFR